MRSLLLLSVVVFALGFAPEAHAAAIYSETLNGNGETRVITTRTFTAPQSGLLGATKVLPVS